MDRIYDDIVDDIYDVINTHFEQTGERLFTDCMKELDDITRVLGEARHRPMREMMEMFTRTTDAGDVKNLLLSLGEGFNPLDKFFYRSGFDGKIYSTDFEDYSDFYGSYIWKALMEHREDIPTIQNTPPLKSLFDEMAENKNALVYLYH